MRERTDIPSKLFTRAGVTVDSKRQGNYRGVEAGVVTGLWQFEPWRGKPECVVSRITEDKLKNFCSLKGTIIPSFKLKLIVIWKKNLYLSLNSSFTQSSGANCTDCCNCTFAIIEDGEPLACTLSHCNCRVHCPARRVASGHNILDPLVVRRRLTSCTKVKRNQKQTPFAHEGVTAGWFVKSLFPVTLDGALWARLLVCFSVAAQGTSFWLWVLIWKSELYTAFGASSRLCVLSGRPGPAVKTCPQPRGPFTSSQMEL